ncbi:MAG: AAA family ATPase, partial [Bacteroides sp.]|nr:AAA family ATPase [Bacteroides sp.]
METTYRRFPIGIQNFEDLRNNNCVYIDKTELIYKLTHTAFVCFLSRPPKFGKSLLTSTIEAYFLGKRKLFEGLAIEKLEKEWTEYPVIRLAFDNNVSWNVEVLQMAIESQLSIWEKKYGIETNLSHSVSNRFTEILRQLNESTGKKVVFLVDGYDIPMWQQKNLLIRKELRDVLSQIFRPIKGCGKYLNFVFITGLSALDRSDMTGELNNLQNISMRDEYSALCGITEDELLTQLQPYIQRMADANNETYEEACAHLKKQYDGYHFSENSEDIYNPFSLFNALNAKKYKNYWFSTGTPTFLIELLQNVQFDVRMMDNMTAMDDQFDAPTEVITDPIPVLYQSGYLTIKGYDPMFKSYTLAYPNSEVRYGFTEALLPRYVH